MRINNLKLYNYRNLKNGLYTIPPGVTCVVGDNGQGKTNLIEAISLLSHTRSFRTSSLDDLVSWGKKESSVFAEALVQNETTEIGISIQEGKRKSFINGKNADSVMSILGILSCVAFSPSDLTLVKGPPVGRRRFFDRHVADNEPSTIRAYIEYQRALKQKNALLKSGRADIHGLKVWNNVITPQAKIIINSRIKLLRELESRLAAISSRLFSDEGSIAIKIKGPSAHLIEDKAGDEVSEEEINKQYEEAVDREISRQSCLVGPHRDDIVPFLFGKDARAFASQGQSRSIVLALKLSAIELIESRREEAPIVLLDDVDSELDEKRRTAIFESIFSKPRQVLITATEYRLPQQLKEKVSATIEIKSGDIVG